jgi:thiol-disulfide isomerase/thioredoxin
VELPIDDVRLERRVPGRLSKVALCSSSAYEREIPGAAWSEDNTAEFDVSRYDGKIVLLDFWASRCGPCAESFPRMSEMNARYAEQSLVVAGVNLDENRDDAERFLAEHPSDFAQVFNPEGTLAEAYSEAG